MKRVVFILYLLKMKTMELMQMVFITRIDMNLICPSQNTGKKPPKKKSNKLLSKKLKSVTERIGGRLRLKSMRVDYMRILMQEFLRHAYPLKVILFGTKTEYYSTMVNGLKN